MSVVNRSGKRDLQRGKSRAKRKTRRYARNSYQNPGSRAEAVQRVTKRATRPKTRRIAKNRVVNSGSRAGQFHTASLTRTRTTIVGKKRRRIVKRKRAIKQKRSRVARAAKSNRRRGVPPGVMAAVRSHARRAGVPVSVGFAVVQQESSFNPRARGQVGEIGLMQVKCSTARTMGYRGRCSGLYNVNTNLRYGMKYLRRAMNKGSVGYYNAGISARRLPTQAKHYARSVADKQHDN